jgi:hypothetical protein
MSHMIMASIISQKTLYQAKGKSRCAYQHNFSQPSSHLM